MAAISLGFDVSIGGLTAIPLASLAGSTGALAIVYVRFVYKRVAL